MNNEILEYIVVLVLGYMIGIVLTAGIMSGLYHIAKYPHQPTPEPAGATIPAEYRETYRQAQEVYQEWIEGATRSRQSEIREWAWHEFNMPLPLMRRHNLFLADFVGDCRAEYMRENNIYEVDELEGL